MAAAPMSQPFSSHPDSPRRSPEAGTLRERIVRAATTVTCESGWSSVTMGRLADMVGVSRQTVYNEIGGKLQLAEEVVFAELRQFLAIVDDAFAAHPDDLVAAVRRACHDVLEHAQHSPLLHAVVSASHGAETDLLPLLTTRATTLIETAKAAVRARVAPLTIGLPEHEIDASIDVTVRTVLSHVMQPGGTPEHTADGIALVAQRMLLAHQPAN